MTSLSDCDLHLSLATPDYTYETIHILHQLFFNTLSVTDVICDFECFITFLCIAHFHFIIVLFFY